MCPLCHYDNLFPLLFSSCTSANQIVYYNVPFIHLLLAFFCVYTLQMTLNRVGLCYKCFVFMFVKKYRWNLLTKSPYLKLLTLPFANMNLLCFSPACHWGACQRPLNLKVLLTYSTHHINNLITTLSLLIGSCQPWIHLVNCVESDGDSWVYK